MRVFLLLSVLLPGPALALELDCVAELACVSVLEECQATEVPYTLKVGRKVGSKVVFTDEDGARSYEFLRLKGREGVRLQATGGALETGQGAGALTVFDDLGFVLTRHSLIFLDGADAPGRAAAISIHGRCEEPE